MNSIEILLQGEGIPDIQLVKLEEGKFVRDILVLAHQQRKGQPVAGEFLVFAEDEEEPLDPDSSTPEARPGEPLRLHVHRCHKIETLVTFNGETKEHHFSPSTTIEVVKRWAAIKAFHLTPADAAEHVLQITGTTTRPDPDTHIGSLVSGTHCKIGFNLVPHKRVEG